MARSRSNENLLVPALIFIFAIVFFNNSDITKEEYNEIETHSDDYLSNQKTRIWFFRKNGSTKIFDTARSVLTMLDIEEVENDATSAYSLHYDWDLLWSQDHQMALPIDWGKIKFHQKINHIPGSRHLTSKSILGTESNSKYVPKAFLNVADVRNYTRTYPNKRFVVKLKSNRGVALQNVTDMNFTNSAMLTDYFAMEFIEDPLLFNGHKFDFAVYVVITSFNPLRLYYYNKNIIMRFCPKTYDTSDPTDLDRYVVSPSHIPGSKFHGIKEFFENGYTYKEGFNAFLRSVGADERKIWKEVENLIRSVVLSKEHFFIKEHEFCSGPRHSFFELYRFDLILDKNFNLYVIEINQSPNIYASQKYLNNQHVYENLLYNLFNLIGVGTSYRKTNLKFFSMSDESMVVHQNSLTVNPEVCMSSSSEKTCDSNKELCWKNLNKVQQYDRLLAYLEQMNSGEMKRLFPPKEDFVEEAAEEFWITLLPESRLHAEWFVEMCKKNEKFC